MRTPIRLTRSVIRKAVQKYRFQYPRSFRPVLFASTSRKPTDTVEKLVPITTASRSVIRPVLYWSLTAMCPTEKFPRKADTMITAARPGSLNTGRMTGRTRTPTKSTRP